jgi:hypothetical protein
MNQTQVERHGPGSGEAKDKQVTVEVNGKAVVLADKNVTGLQVKQAAIAQKVEIQLDFILVLEAEHGNDPRQIADGEQIKVDKHSRFTCNDGEDDS